MIAPTVSASGDNANLDLESARGLSLRSVNFRLLAKDFAVRMHCPHCRAVNSPLGRTTFRYFVAGRLVSLLGSSMAPVALAFAVLDASGDPSQLGIVLAARMVPMLCFVLVGGAAADRFPRRTVLVATNAGGAAAQGAVAVLLMTHNYDLLLVGALSAVNGILDAFTSPALRGLVPELVEKDQLRKANALLSSVRNGTKIVGPAVAGVLVAVVGSGPTIAVDAASYLLAVVLLGRLETGSPTPLVVRRGWREFRSIRWVWAVTLSSALMNLAQTGAWQVLGPPLTGARLWGFALSARGVGLLVMSALMYRLVVRHLLRTGQVFSVLGALPLLALGVGAPSGWVLVAAFTAGAGFSISGISWDTSLQEHIDRGVLSRLASIDDLLSYAAIPAGLLLAGPLASHFGGRPVTLAAAIVYTAAAWSSLLFKEVRELPHGSRG
ncbi:putative MFS family arabinose efflux permease [Kribbella rubisoli]|uniref:MFS family arabinose efflux permease n=1 Tax=Kribbella rubisoli TaxID=3075929 RepID=A0A4Q7WYY6_9ACTN|nr:putative MFS family arabinose efflux permease [Kribbella rubisoli]